LRYVLTGTYAVLFVVFAVSASSKLVAPGAFAASLRPLRLLPERLVRPTAALVTVAELAVAAGLAWAVLADLVDEPADAVGGVSLVLAGLLLAVLTTGIVLALRRGADAKCACFGAAEQPLGGRHLVRNGVLLAVVLVGLLMLTVAEDGSAVAGSVVGLGAGAIVALVLIRLDDLVELFTPVPASRSRS
jgi:hypothetical protein